MSQETKIRIIFMGSPDFALPSMQALIDAEDIELLALITQPDKPVGRKQIITAPPTKTLALQNGIAIYQPDKISQDQELIKLMQSLNPDFLVTVAYGQILKANILEIAPVINLHASLLPEFRGPAPINWMIIHGDTRAGLSTMLTDIGVDTGDILLKMETNLYPSDNAETLTSRLSELGAPLLLKTLREFKSIKAIKQVDLNSARQRAPFMDKALGEIKFSNTEMILASANPKQNDFKFVQKNSAINIHNLVRATYPWPGAYFMINDQKIIILETKVSDRVATKEKPGTIVGTNKEDASITVQTQEGLLEILKLKPQGKSEMRAYDWLNGQSQVKHSSSSFVLC